VKHVDGISELGNVDDPECPGCIPNPNFLHALAYGFHRLPVVRLLAVLMASLAPSREWKGAKVIQRTASKLNRLGVAQIFSS
jgi:hypothetical protein